MKPKKVYMYKIRGNGLAFSRINTPLIVFIFCIRDFYFPCCIGVYIMTVVLLLYGILSTYRISYVVTAALVLMAAPQVVSKLNSSPPQKDRNM